MASNAALVRVIRKTCRADWSSVNDRELLRRFVEEGNQDAFAALVHRHGDLVLGACRRALPTAQDAEDACQATFLVLVKKAGSQRWQPSVASYLYATARKVAGNARQALQRRARREGQAAVPEAVEPIDEVSGRELLAVLDEELEKLPPRYREPLVLCYLEGLTRDEVAARLGIPAATVKTQLERGRKKLGDALTRRGCGLGAGLLALAITSPAGASSPRLVEAVLGAVSGSPPAAVAALARGSIVNTLVNRVMVAVLVVAAVLGAGLGGLKLAASQQAGQKAEQAPDSKPKAAKPAIDQRKGTVSGRVLNPDGKPQAGTEILLVEQGKKAEKLAVTGADGKFSVTAPRGKRWSVLLARMAGMGSDFLDLGRLPEGDVELRMVRDEPIRGRVIDTQGKPVQGVRVSVSHVGVYGDNTIEPFLTIWKNKRPNLGLPVGIKHLWNEDVFTAVTTDKEGRFAITGTGAERLVALRFRGANIAETEAWVVHRARFDPKPYNQKGMSRMPKEFGFAQKFQLHGPEPTIIAEAEKRIRGVVKDQDSGAPRPGVKVTLSRNGNTLVDLPLSAVTDAQGRYEIRGARKASDYLVEVNSDPVNGYVAAQARASDTEGYAPLTLDVHVKKGVILTGRVIDVATGRPIPGWAAAAALADNPQAKGYPEFNFSAFADSGNAYTNEDGVFRLVSVPGPVVLMGGPDSRRLPEGELANHRFRLPVGDPKYPQYFSPMYQGTFFPYSAVDRIVTQVSGPFWTIQLGKSAISLLKGNYCKLLNLEPGTTVRQDILVERATPVKVKVTDSAGQALTGFSVTGISPEETERPTRITTDTFSAYHFRPGKPRLLAFHEPAGKLFGTLTLKGDEKEAVVKLGAAGAVKGRVLDEDGRPLAGVRVWLFHPDQPVATMHAQLNKGKAIETDADGKFEIGSVLPGATFWLDYGRGKSGVARKKKPTVWSVQPGKTLDLGDVKVKLEP
jgi:RNA polymerase sigma factor (sigma-70 family)